VPTATISNILSMTITVLQRPITDPAHAVSPGRSATATAVAVGPAAPAARQWMHQRWKVALLLVGGVAMVFTLRGRMPSWADMGTALASAEGRWLLAGAAAQVVSMGMFALQQQRLLRALGVAVGIGRLQAISYARSALSIALPGGSVISAAFALKQYRARGASNQAAATAMILSGMVSAGALLLLASAWTALRSRPEGHHTMVSLIGAGVAGAAGLAAVRFRAGARTRLATLVDRLGVRWPMVATATESVTQAARAIAAMRRRDVLYAVGFAVLNWLGDVLCLVAAVRAVGIDLPVLTDPRRRISDRSGRPADPDHPGRDRRHRGESADGAGGRRRRERPGRGGRAHLPDPVLLADHPGRAGVLDVPAGSFQAHRPCRRRYGCRCGMSEANGRDAA
jgi:uncharacterized membrane protein YbhN (UPF0104 family)